MTRRLLAGLIVTGLAFVLVARADDPAKDKGDRVDPSAAAGAAATKQDRLARQFRDFENALLRLAQRMADSPRQEDKQKALILRKAIEEANTHGIDTKFDKLRLLVQDSKTFEDLTKIQTAIEYNRQVMEDVKFILQILLTDNRDAQLLAERKKVEDMLRRLNQIIRDQNGLRARTDRNEKKEGLAKDQNRIAKDTDALAKGQPKPAEDKGDTRIAKADFKDPKDIDGKKGDGKEDTKDAKVGDKAPDAKAGDPKDEKKPGDPKDGKDDDKKGDAKPGDSKSSDGKDDKKGSGKPGDGKDSKKGDAKPGDSKSGDDKKADAKPGDSKDGNKGDAKPGEPKKGETKVADAKAGKPGDPKGEGKPSEAKPGDGKPSDSKGKGDGKGEGKPGEGKSGKPGQQSQSAQNKPSQSSGQSGQQGEGKDDKPQQAQNQPPKQDDQGNTNPAKKQIKEAYEKMQEAEKKIKVPDNEKATKDQTDALQKLEEAKRKLEDLLRQLRQEEIERLLAALQMRCERMLAMQIEVRDGTVKVFKDIDAREDKKADRADQQTANKLSDKEEEIIHEANKAIQILSAEGSAVAFPEVFTQIRDDMVNVARRLRATDVSLFTQRIENDIIATLQEMIEALKKARQENQNKQPPKPGQPGQPGPQKLIELLQELKMIRSLQIRVNKRTEDYAREYQGEQAPPAAAARSPEEREKTEIVNKELKNLSERQKKIGDITDNLRKNMQQQ